MDASGNESRSEQVAMYWDFENVHAGVLDEIEGEGAYKGSLYKAQKVVLDLGRVVELAAGYGDICINRAYGNWQWLWKYRSMLQDHAFDLVQLFPLSGTKNGADIRLTADVMDDLAQHPRIGVVVVLSSDSDFVGLAQRCRKYGKAFIGVGTEWSNRRYASACTEFHRYSSLAPDREEAAAEMGQVGGIVLPGPGAVQLDCSVSAS